MTYKKLYEDALFKLDRSIITLGEFEEMTKPLDREVEQEPTDKNFTIINDLEELRTMINKFAESYENRLKADMVAMLTDMLIDVEEIASREQWCDYANDNCISRYDVEDLFQQKINALKADTEDQDV